MLRRSLFLVFVSLSIATPAVGQNSVYAITGLGFPGRLLSARALALGGGVAPFDRESGINPAAAGAYNSVGAGFSLLNSRRSYTANGTRVDNLRDTRFPGAMVGGNLGRTGFSVSIGYSLFAERTYDVGTTDQIMLRGDTVTAEDRIGSNGGISDLHLSLAKRLGSSVWVGVAGHFVSGSTRSSVSRVFSNPLFEPVSQIESIEYFGKGLAFGFVALPTDAIQVGGSVRYDGELQIEASSGESSVVDLPLHVSAGLIVRPQLAVQWSATFTWRGWSAASDDLGAIGLGRAFDTWEVGTGLEIGGGGAGTSRVPLRFGFRYAQLPFSASIEQPTELNVSVGTGLRFANERAAVDLSLERAIRDGAGANEKAWLLALGISVRP